MFLTLLAACLVAGAGCKKAPPLESKAFDTAAPELKSSWQLAVAAMKTNGYALGLLELQNLRMRSDLTPQQISVIEDASKAFNDRFYAALDKDEPAAQEALKLLRSSARR